MRGPCLLIATSLCLSAATAGTATAARCEPRGEPWLEARIVGALGPPARAVDARAGDEIEVFLVLPGTLDGRPVVFSEAASPTRPRGRASWTQAGCGDLQVSWRRVEPRMIHTNTRAPNTDLPIYANAQVFGPAHGRWLGYDRLEYIETPLREGGLVLRVRDARPSAAAGVAARAEGVAGLGVMRLAASVQRGGTELRTPGMADAGVGGVGLISERVLRYTYRGGDDFLGWLTSFFNVPYLFGSAGEGRKSQAERYQGADCADVLVAALRRAGWSAMRYTSVEGLVDALQPVGHITAIIRPTGAPRQAGDGEPPRVGADLRPGDLLALDYVGAASLPRAWDHIGVFVEDRGPGGKPDGQLGPEDLLADSGDGLGLKFAPLGDQGVVRVAVLRPRAQGR